MTADQRIYHDCPGHFDEVDAVPFEIAPHNAEIVLVVGNVDSALDIHEGLPGVQNRYSFRAEAPAADSWAVQ